jgi:uncharacterized protein involved in exopolysaccharide biosynthesis
VFPLLFGRVRRTFQDQVNSANAEAFCSAITALSDALAAERARVEQLLMDLADARAAERISADHAPDTVTAEPVGTDPLTAIGIQTLSQAVEMLREDLAIANSSLLSEHERAETERQDARRRMDELQRRIDGLHTDLADTRAAAMIAGSEAAALRAQADERRGWRPLRRLRWTLRGE